MIDQEKALVRAKGAFEKGEATAKEAVSPRELDPLKTQKPLPLKPARQAGS